MERRAIYWQSLAGRKSHKIRVIIAFAILYIHFSLQSKCLFNQWTVNKRRAQNSQTIFFSSFFFSLFHNAAIFNFIISFERKQKIIIKNHFNCSHTPHIQHKTWESNRIRLFQANEFKVIFTLNLTMRQKIMRLKFSFKDFWQQTYYVEHKMWLFCWNGNWLAINWQYFDSKLSVWGYFYTNIFTSFISSSPCQNWNAIFSARIVYLWGIILIFFQSHSGFVPNTFTYLAFWWTL